MRISFINHASGNVRFSFVEGRDAEGKNVPPVSCIIVTFERTGSELSIDNWQFRICQSPRLNENGYCLFFFSFLGVYDYFQIFDVFLGFFEPFFNFCFIETNEIGIISFLSKIKHP